MSSWPYPLSDFCHQSAPLSSSRPDLSVRYTFVRANYHDAVRSRKVPRPDCVAALNCGFVFYKVGLVL